MTGLSAEKLSFTYPNGDKMALDSVDIRVEQGDFAVLMGPSGCGKTTLLRHMKSALPPHGTRSGGVFLDGEALDSVPPAKQCAAVGFVGQSPENQIVTDKVWHELAFGLESLGEKTPVIRRRCAEMAAFFGIEDWFYKKTDELSGGQKQILNLASVMMLRPEFLVLDEPTSMLDPVAAADFLALVIRINRELGTGVIMSEHRLEEILPAAGKVYVLDSGRVIWSGSTQDTGEFLRRERPDIFLAMPAPMRIWSAVPNTLPCPVTAGEGARWLESYAREHPLLPLPEAKPLEFSAPAAAQAKELRHRYDKNGPDVLKGLSLSVYPGEILALLGGNGTGKTTVLKVLAGQERPYGGKAVINGRGALLPQDPKVLFLKKTLAADLDETLESRKIPQDRREKLLEDAVKLCRLEGLLNRHPYDLSGGEQQRAALAKILLNEPDVLLLDEPTKGMDAEYKAEFARILRSLADRGTAIVMASHDLEFCAGYAHRCALMFDGIITAQGAPREFFCGNYFYTTSSSRMARKLLPEAVTPGDVIAACGGRLPEPPVDNYPEPPKSDMCPPPKEKEQKPGGLPLWRKITALLTGAAAVVFFALVMGRTDLSGVFTNGGIAHGAAGNPGIYGGLIISLLGFALSVGSRPGDVAGHGVRKKLTPGRAAAVAAALLLIPLTIFVGIYYFGDRKYYFISLLVLIEAMGAFAAAFEGGRPKGRELVIIAVLCALAAAGRAAFFMLPSFKPVLALVIISGAAFGGETGFLVGAVTMLVSNIMFGQGPWTPWQMFAMGMGGFLPGVLFAGRPAGRTDLSIFGAAAALLVYGPVMNLGSLVIWQTNITWGMVLAALIAGFPFDLVHAASTVIFLWLIAEPMLEKLERVKIKYGIME